MKLEPSDINDLKPVIAAIVHAVLDDIRDNESKLNGRLAFGEAEVASLLGLARHVLRDCRLRGEIKAGKVGNRIVYSRSQLLEFLHGQSSGGSC